MHAAGLRRAGFLATVAAALLMLGSAIHGMTRVDTSLQIAAASRPERLVLVVDERERRWHAPARDCDGPRERGRRI
jgi:hypothetical protein